MKIINLKAHILVPLALVSVLVLAAFIYGVYSEAQEHLTEDLAHSIQGVEGHYQAALKERAHKLGAALEVIAADTVLRSALAAHNRGALLARAMPVFQRLKTKYNVTHFYFHDGKRINILRVHQPGRYGDTIDRFTALGAEKTKTLSYDIELGPLGTFTLRAVLPIWQEDELLGYIELGEEVGQIMEDMESVFGIDIVIIIDKQYLREEDWVAGMTMLGRETQWDHFPSVVVISHRMSELPPDLSTILSQPLAVFSAQNIVVNRKDQRYWGRILNLQDAGERNVGGMVVLRNMTARIESTRNTAVLISGGTLLLGTSLFLLFYFILGRVERHLRKLFAELQESQLHLTNAQRMAHLGNWEWDLQHNLLHCSDETARIFGLEKGDCPCRFEELVSFIHPEDRDNFTGLIERARHNSAIHELTHRIVRQDGSQRTVRHRAQLIPNSVSAVHSVNATIHDITELQQAETRSVRMGRILANSWNEIYAFDMNTLHFVEVSDGACQNLGYSMEEMLQLTPVDLKPQYNHAQYNALIEPLRQGEMQQISFEAEHSRHDGSRYPVEVRLQLSREENPPVFIAIIQDISERQHYIKELEHKILYDTLTELPNRALLQDRLDHTLKTAHREAYSVAVLLVDVVRLREINDLLGHHNGDLVLKEIAIRLQKGLRESDTIARLGGDEFVIVLANVDAKQAEVAAGKIQKQFEQPIIVEGTPLELEAAIGAALYPDHGETPAILLQYADIAMHVAKNETNGFSSYNPNNDPFSVRRLKLHGELRQAINEKLLAVFYQPKIDIKTGRVSSVEALARWPHPTEGMISPADFIPMVEHSGMIRPFTLWVLEQAIKQSKHWTDMGIDLTVAVNLSTRNLLDPSLADSIMLLLEANQVNPDRIILEITESAIMSRPDYALKILVHLHTLGFKLSIDDFGTGYSSLAYLKQLPVSELKVDYSFVSGIACNDSDAVIVRSTIELAHNLGLSVVAEGVENRETLDILAILRCETAQGFYFSRPLPVDELSTWLTESVWGTGSILRTALKS